MSHEIIVQFQGYEVKALVREYTFTVREASTEPREYTLTIPTEAFNEHRCVFKMRRTFARASSTANWRRTPTIRRTLAMPSPTRNSRITAAPARPKRRDLRSAASPSKTTENRGVLRAQM